jgi:hypothetical protein
MISYQLLLAVNQRIAPIQLAKARQRALATATTAAGDQ